MRRQQQGRQPEVCASWTASYAVLCPAVTVLGFAHTGGFRAQTLLRWRRAPRRDGSRRRRAGPVARLLVAADGGRTAADSDRLQRVEDVAVPPGRPRRLRHRSHHNGGRRRRHAGARDVGRRSEGADRLLLRLSHDLHRSDAEQRHASGSGRDERRQAAVRPVRVEMPAVHADLPPGDAGWPAPHAGAGRGGDAGPGHSVRRCEERVEPLPAARQQGARLRARRAFAGLVHSQSPDPRRDRRQTDPVADAVGDSARHGDRGAERQGRRRIVPARAALPVGIAAGLRHHLRIVPLDDRSAGEHPVRQGPRRGHGRRVHQPGRARRRQRRAARVSRRDGPYQSPATRRRSRG